MATDIEIVRSDSGNFALHDGKEYELFLPAIPGEDNAGVIVESLVDGLKQTLATFGAKFDEGKQISGEFILQSRFSKLQSMGVSGYDCTSAKVRDRTWGLGLMLAFPEGELARVLEALGQEESHEDGLLGPRGSVFIFGTMRTLGTWPLHKSYLVVDRWIVVGRQNDLDTMLRQTLAAAELGLKIAMKLQGWSKTSG